MRGRGQADVRCAGVWRCGASRVGRGLDPGVGVLPDRFGEERDAEVGDVHRHRRELVGDPGDDPVWWGLAALPVVVADADDRGGRRPGAEEEREAQRLPNADGTWMLEEADGGLRIDVAEVGALSVDAFYEGVEPPPSPAPA